MAAYRTYASRSLLATQFPVLVGFFCIARSRRRCALKSYTEFEIAVVAERMCIRRIHSSGILNVPSWLLCGVEVGDGLDVVCWIEDFREGQSSGKFKLWKLNCALAYCPEWYVPFLFFG